MGKFHGLFFHKEFHSDVMEKKKVQLVELYDTPGRASATVVKGTGNGNSASQSGLAPVSQSQMFAGSFLI